MKRYKKKCRHTQTPVLGGAAVTHSGEVPINWKNGWTHQHHGRSKN